MSKTKKVIIIIVAVFVLLCIVAANSEDDKSSSGATTTTKKVRKGKFDGLEYPEAQQKLIDATIKAQEAAKNSDNDMKKGGALSTRSKEICAGLKSYSVNNWVGIISEIGANSDGLGVVSIEVAKDIFIKTWNNSLSDMFDNTLIQQGTSLFDAASEMKKGQRVKFSGNFFKDDSGCIRESSLSLNGKLKDPNFIFKFYEISVIE